MMKITAPTTKLLPATKLANVSITAPASPSVKISRVEEMFSAKRNIVVINKIVGKVENSNTFFVNRVSNNMVIDNAMLITNIKSSNPDGKGIIIIARIAITKKATITSKEPVIFSNFPQKAVDMF